MTMRSLAIKKHFVKCFLGEELRGLFFCTQNTISGDRRGIVIVMVVPRTTLIKIDIF